ncbi:MAG: gluconokinase [Frankiaceae bacterium]
MDVVVGLDSGTTATKAVASGVTGEIRAVTSVGYPLLVPAPGHAELDAWQLRAAAVQALGEVAQAVAIRGDRVVAVCLSAAMHGLVPLDGGGDPTGRVITWADGRAAAATRALKSRAGGTVAKRLHQRTGTPVHPMSPLLKLMHLSALDSAAVRATPRWGGVKELVAGALCGGGHVTDLSSASGTGMYVSFRRRWDAAALELAGVRAGQLAEVVPTTAVLGRLRPEIAASTRVPAGVAVVAGATDGVLANLGVGAVSPQVGAVSLGTSGALRAVQRWPGVDDAGRLFCYALTEDRWVLGGAVNNGGSAVRWASGALAAPIGPAGVRAPAADADALDEQLTVEAARAPVGSGGLLCLPYLLGERAPWWEPGLRGAFIGLRRDHTRAHLVRAMIEGVCQQLALVRDALAATVPVCEIRATGGAVASPLWVSTLASALDLLVRIAHSPEGTGLGACLLGLHALGAFDNLDTAASVVAVHEPVTPDPAAAATYRRIRPLVEQATLRLADLFLELDAFSAAPAPAPAGDSG